MIYPQAIQVGRLLNYSKNNILAICCESINRDNFVFQEEISSKNYKTFTVKESPIRFPVIHKIMKKIAPLYGSIPDEYRGWTVNAFRQLQQEKIIENYKPDMIVSFGEPMSDHLLALKIHREYGLPWISHFSDPWADNPYRKKYKLSYSINRNLECDVIKNASRFIFTTDETKVNFESKYGDKIKDNSYILPHSYDPKLYPISSKKDFNKDPRVARYIGNFYGGRTPLPLIRAVEAIKKYNPEILNQIRFEFVGDLPLWMRYFKEIRTIDNKIISLLPTVSYMESIKIMTDSDLLIVIDAPSKSSEFLPSKLVEYLGANKPILGITPPGAAQKLIENVKGMVADPTNVLEIASRITEFVSACDMGNNEIYVSDYRKKYQIKNISEKFDDILYSCYEEINHQ